MAKPTIAKKTKPLSKSEVLSRKRWRSESACPRLLGTGLALCLLLCSAAVSAESQTAPVVAGVVGAAASVANGCPDPKTFTGPYEAQVSKLNAALGDKDDVIRKLQGDVAAKSKQISDLLGSLDAKTRENTTLLASLSRLDEEKTHLGNTLAKEQAAAAAAKLKYEKVSAQVLVANARDKVALLAESERLRTEVDADDSALNKTQSALDSKAIEVTEVTQNLAKASEESASLETLLKGAQLEAEAKDQLLARHSAYVAVGVVTASALVPALTIGLYLMLLHAQSNAKKKSEVFERYKAIAIKLRAERDNATSLHESEEHLLEDLVGNRMLLSNIRSALRFGVILSVVGAVALALAGIWFVRDLSLGQEHVDLVKGATWQALVGLFTPVAALIAAVTIAQTKYKDAVGHCLAAELICRTPKRSAG